MFVKPNKRSSKNKITKVPAKTPLAIFENKKEKKRLTAEKTNAKNNN